MIYEERTKGNRLYAILMLMLVICAYMPFLPCVRVLTKDEAIFGSMAQEIRSFPPIITLYGDLVQGGFPLFPTLAACLNQCGIPVEIALRLLPLAAMFLVAGIVFLTAYRALGLQAAAAGMASLFSCMIAADKLPLGIPVMLTGLAVFAAWMVWFDLGIWRNNWNMAWYLSMVMAGLCFYTSGIQGLLLTVVPMFFLRRPLMLKTKPRGFGFFAGFSVFLMLVLLWAFPRWTGNDLVYSTVPALDILSFRKYIFHLLFFPFDAAVRFMPWTLLAWAPFCPAFTPLDKNPLLSKYLKTLFIAMFCMLWISPFYQSSQMLLLLPPMAVLISLHYWIAVRRFGGKILVLCKYASIVALCYAAGCFWMTEVPFDGTDQKFLYILAGIFCACCSLVMSIRHSRVWLTLMVLFLGFFLPFQGTVRAVKTNEKSELAEKMREAMKDDLTEDDLEGIPLKDIYRMRELPVFPTEYFYLRKNIHTIGSAAELPEENPTVYVLAPSAPSAPERIWRCVSEMNIKTTRLQLWRGDSRNYNDEENEEEHEHEYE